LQTKWDQIVKGVEDDQRVNALVYSILKHNMTLLDKLKNARAVHSTKLSQQLLPAAEAGEALASQAQGIIEKEVDVLNVLPLAVLGRQSALQAATAGKGLGGT
jgi:hypothetical protein